MRHIKSLGQIESGGPSALVIAAVLGATTLVTPAAQSGLVTSTWIGGVTGSWNVAGNWSPAGIPNNGADTFQAVIDGNAGTSSAVTLNASVFVSSIIIGGDDSLSLANGTFLGLAGGPLENDGIVTIGSAGATTDFRLESDSIFDGSGVFSGSNTTANRLYGNSGAVRLTNASDHTIGGAMQLGANQLRLTNQGTITATLPQGITLDLTDTAGVNFNSGVMRGEAGSTLRVQGLSIDNTGGLIEAAAGGTVDLNQATIIGGTLRDADGAGSGAVRVISTATLAGTGIEGPLAIVNGGLLLLTQSTPLPGTVVIGSAGATTDLRIDSSPFTLGGGGTVAGSNTQANRFYGISGATELTIAPDTTVRGGLALGANQLRLVNQGLVQADTSAGITVDLSDGDGLNFNSGTMRATSGATMTMSGFNLINDGGLVEADAGSNVVLQSFGIIGGTIRDVDGDGPGEVRVNGTVFLDSSTTEGPFRIGNGSFLQLFGTPEIVGRIALSSAGSTTDLRIDTSPLTLGGGGEIVGSNTQANRLYGASGAHTLQVPADFTIRGSLALGANQMRLENDGLIAADTSSGMTIDLTDTPDTSFNSGTIRSENGATLQITATHLTNSGGVIEAGAASTTTLVNSTIIGGTIRDVDGDGAGQVRCVGVTTLEAVTVEGPLVVQNGSVVVVRETIDLDGRLDVSSLGATTDVRCDTNPTLLTGGGTIAFSNTQANRLYGGSAAARIVNDAGNTIRGAANIGAGQSPITNHGFITCDATGGMTIDPADSQDFTNAPSGVLVAQGGNITLSAGPFLNQGGVLVAAGRQITRSGDYVQTAGSTSVLGTLQVLGGSLALQGGELSGTGLVAGGLTNNTGGVVAPGAGIGAITLGNGYTQGAGGELRIEIGGTTPITGHDRLTVTGNATLAGTLTVLRVPNFIPQPGDEFTFLTTSGAVIGEFNLVDSCDPVEIIYAANSVKLRFTSTFGPLGDLNDDGVVNGADLGGLLGAWGPCLVECCAADLNGDGDVNGADLGILLGGWT